MSLSFSLAYSCSACHSPRPVFSRYACRFATHTHIKIEGERERVMSPYACCQRKHTHTVCLLIPQSLASPAHALALSLFRSLMSCCAGVCRCRERETEKGCLLLLLLLFLTHTRFSTSASLRCCFVHLFDKRAESTIVTRHDSSEKVLFERMDDRN